MTRSATSLMRPTSATLDPPYFWTTTDIAGLQKVEIAGREGRRRLPLLTSFYLSFLQFCNSAMRQGGYPKLATTGAWSLVPIAVLTAHSVARAASAALANT